MENKKRSDSFYKRQKENQLKIWQIIKKLILQICEQNKSELNSYIEYQVENLSIFAKDKSPKNVKDYYNVNSYLKDNFQKLAQQLGFNLNEQILKSFSEQSDEVKDNEASTQDKKISIQEQLYNQMVYLGSNDASIHFSKDSRFVLKGIPQSQFNTFLREVNEVCLSSIYTKQHLLSVRIFGLFQIESEEIRDQSLELPYNYFILMENILYDWDFEQNQIKSIYDLKGSSVGRQYEHIESSDNEDIQEQPKSQNDSPKGNKDQKFHVFFGKDNDFKNKESDRNILKSLPQQLKQEIIQQLKEECHHYESLNLMDYSLMVVIGQNIQKQSDKKSQYETQNKFRNIQINEYVVSLAVIDYLCQFNFRKSLESTFKSFFCSNPNQISCVEPDIYYERIVKYATQEIFTISQN
ncbi:phosphatidylinositol 4-phosphate 5-kinase (macronuclear) [Tetrahymena thermophila SB210]|uniref:Phosphatidylinositol 4-phosphate 5-kinase n=1 Tax=Tetrahymena thermophila (strain SB210) TaxID=312017 RepID=I7MIV9_TETTS|nr:phosphatidylinositol 4-phosphate 5-kinase [Tetrahymena thermophila SB210]EAS04792.2 phosphatidylinositol 4-phosphate 5-kinase [Tetrahymena thermophila SB210]|eukprot:XP_001025037.2 phosphatidylinositol 4-phosphate 5-kinase [Tetrahymena thermophila SB210]